MEALLKGANRLTPDSSKQKKRQPYTPTLITKVREKLAFDPTQHVTPANLHMEKNQSNMEVTVLHIPKTKAAPLQALANHQHINNPSNTDHLFVYCHKGHLWPLTKSAFIKCIAVTAHAAGLEPLQGHGIRISATLFYLLQGIPMEAMKVMGRWSSNAFLWYLHKHAQILTPYIQADPEVHWSFSQFIMPSQAMQQGRH